jgi:hypothetical protein
VNLEEIAAAQVAVARPGDTIIVGFKDHINQEQADQIKRRLAAIAPDLRTLVFDGLDFMTVMQKESE